MLVVVIRFIVISSVRCCIDCFIRVVIVVVSGIRVYVGSVIVIVVM